MCNTVRATAAERIILKERHRVDPHPDQKLRNSADLPAAQCSESLVRVLGQVGGKALVRYS